MAAVSSETVQKTLVLPRVGPDRETSRETRATKQLQPLASRFVGFHDEIVLVKHKQQEELEHKFAALQTQISSLEQAIVKESRHRETAMQAQQLWFRDRLQALRTEVEVPLQASISSLHVELNKLHVLITELQAAHEKDRETFPKLIEQSMRSVNEELATLSRQQQQVSSSLQQTISQLERSVEMQWRKLAEQRDVERRQAEQVAMELRAAIDSESDRRTSSVSLLQKRIDEELAALNRTVRQQEVVSAFCIGSAVRSLIVFSHTGPHR